VLDAAAACLAAARGLDDALDPGAAAELATGHDGTVRGLVRAEDLTRLVRRYRAPGTSVSSVPCPVVVDPPLARFGSWYELFPRSTSPGPGRAGTLRDVVERLGYLERLGVDVLYLPPVHPIGTTGRKGAEGTTVGGPDDPGSPWAIGSPAGGHTAVDPDLGTLDDFDALVAAAAERGITVAIDLAFQCSPDHPWVRQHPEWFRHRPDGSIRTAENPPKRYEDIYPLDFETEAWWQLWQELLRVVRFWIGHGVEVFRVDNPHTKPFAFWEWLISSVKADHPEVLLLSEAFTRPKVMERLAKVGFSQSYTYFAWRNTKWEIETYMTELAGVAHFFRPNFWPNTPDILTEALQTGGTAAFVARLVLAATLSANYGIYGPAFELQEHVARSPGSEEYAGSEKYTVRHWDLDRPDSLAPLIGRVNEIRRQHAALQRDDTLRFHQVDNDQLIAYSKTSGDDRVVVVVNLDPFNRQAGWVDVDLGPGADVHDLLTGARYHWAGDRNFVLLDPAAVPAHVFAVEPS
ncbi:MAG: alpha-amylase family glycosyl hydrolase, partial [Acidimicrobiales bacterium]